MALITRHTNAPFADGETLEAADLEADIATMYGAVNGSLDNTNLASGADLSGAKLLDSSLTAAKLANSTLTVAKFAPAAVPKHAVSIITSESWTASTSLADVASVTDADLLAGATTDMVFMDFSATVDPSATGTLIFGWHINGADYDSITSMYVEAGNTKRIYYSSYAILAPTAAASMTIKPRHKVSGSPAASIDSGIFRCWILPGK